MKNLAPITDNLDQVTKQYVDDQSLSVLLEGLRNTSTYTVKYYPGSGSSPYYYVYKIYRQPGVRSLRKVMAHGATTAAQAAANRESPASAFGRTGHNIITTGSGWDVATEDVLRGVQIRDGQLIQPTWNTGGSSNQLGKYVLGQRKDGSIGIYDNDNYTIQDVLDDGVFDTWSHGQALIRNGSPTAASGTDKSAFTVVGDDADGNILILLSYGISGSQGFDTNQIKSLAQSLGFYNAIILDSGGSVQGLANGTTVIASSDVSGSRPLPDFIAVNSTLVSNPTSDWVNLGTPISGSVFSSDSNKYRILKGIGQGRGVLELKLGVTGVTNGDTIYLLPEEARPLETYMAAVTSNGGTDFHININSSGGVGVVEAVNLNSSRAVRAYARIPLD